MARIARADVFRPDEIAIVHVMNRTVRRCFLMGDDPLTGKNFDHRKAWMEDELQRLAACFGIDLLTFAILSNHFHLILRSRPDVGGLLRGQPWFSVFDDIGCGFSMFDGFCRCRGNPEFNSRARSTMLSPVEMDVVSCFMNRRKGVRRKGVRSGEKGSGAKK